jgi:hypothetical protein
MSKPNPKYAVHVRWGDFELNIIGRRTILGWAGTLSLLVGAKVYGAKILSLLFGAI